MPFGAAAFTQSRRELQPIFLPVSPLLSRFGCYFRPSLALSVHPSPTPVHPQVIHAPASHPRLAESTFTIPRPSDPATRRPHLGQQLQHQTYPSYSWCPVPPICTTSIQSVQIAQLRVDQRPSGNSATAYHRVATPLFLWYGFFWTATPGAHSSPTKLTSPLARKAGGFWTTELVCGVTNKRPSAFSIDRSLSLEDIHHC